MDDNELPKEILTDKPWRSTRAWPTEIKMDWRGRGRRKETGLNIGWRLNSTEVAGDICSRRPRPTHGCRAGDDDDYFYPSSRKQE